MLEGVLQEAKTHHSQVPKSIAIPISTQYYDVMGFKGLVFLFFLLLAPLSHLFIHYSFYYKSNLNIVIHNDIKECPILLKMSTIMIVI